jgi:HAD superfamily hydrolase (TIGR01549 family)
MVANADPTRTLADTFAADFFPRVGIARETLMPLFDDFYAREYRELRAYVNPIPEARTVVSHAIAARAPVVIATMPVFPLVAVQQRLAWGKLADFEYALITAYENMRASKPNPAYYREIAEKIGVAPEDCVMVGNEVQNDILPAKRVGMKTFWVTNAAFMATDVPTDWRGTLAEFGALLERGGLDTR